MVVKYTMFILIVFSFCLGYCIAVFQFRGTNNPAFECPRAYRFSPHILIVKVTRNQLNQVCFEVNGQFYSYENVKSELRGRAIAAGTFRRGGTAVANCRVIVQAGSNVRFTDIADLVDVACGGNRIYDVWIEADGMTVPICFRPYLLRHFSGLSTCTASLKPVYLNLLWLEKSSNAGTSSEDGRLSIVIHEVKDAFALRKDGELTLEPEAEKQNIKRFSDWNEVRKALTQTAEVKYNVSISAGPMVHVSDLVRAMVALQDCGGGYEILAIAQ